MSIITQLNDLSSPSDLLPLFGVIALFAGGALMIASASIRLRADQIAQRMTLARRAIGVTPVSQARNTHADRQTAANYGWVEGEHRQIIRLFANFGAPPERALMYFTLARIGLALGIGIGVAVVAPLPSLGLILLCALGGAIVGWFLPVRIVKSRLKRHCAAVSSGLPGALELLAICVEAGLSLENGLQRVARELKGAQPPLADELLLTWAEMTILPSRDQALANMAVRVDLPSVRSVVGTLAQSLRFGSPLAQSLRNAAEEMRNEQLMDLEERANRLPAMMTVPVMLLIMPTIFLIVGGPAALRLLDIFK